MTRFNKAAMSFVAAAALAACQNDVIAPQPRSFDAVPNAVVTFDPSTGNGFVGKGDVQTVYAALGINANNKWLQDVAENVDFHVFSSVSTETSWTCENDGQPPAQQKLRVTTVTTQGIVTTVARDNSKGKDGPVTGFYLRGWEGTPLQGSSSDGPKPPIWDAVNGVWTLDSGTCPANPSGFYLVQSSVQTTQSSNGGGLEVTINNGVNWYPIPAIVP